jgi:hypothetical protein
MYGRTASEPRDTAPRPPGSASGGRIRRPGALAAILLAGLAGLAGCGGSDRTATDDTASPPTTPATTASAPSPSPVPSETEPGGIGSVTATTTSVGGVASCTSRQLSVTAGRQEGAAGHQYRVVVLTNTAGRTCRLRGYPAVAGLDAAGKVAVRARHATGFPQRTVVLHRGDAASALVAGVSVPSGTGTCPPDYAALSVAPPGQSAATRLAVSLPACDGLSVRPVVAGETGE